MFFSYAAIQGYGITGVAAQGFSKLGLLKLWQTCSKISGGFDGLIRGARYLDLQACNCSTKGSDLTFCTMLFGWWLTCSLLAHILLCFDPLAMMILTMKERLSFAHESIFRLNLYTQFPHGRM